MKFTSVASLVAYLTVAGEEVSPARLTVTVAKAEPSLTV
jgi:hypothetical protein